MPIFYKNNYLASNPKVNKQFIVFAKLFKSKTIHLHCLKNIVGYQIKEAV